MHTSRSFGYRRTRACIAAAVVGVGLAVAVPAPSIAGPNPGGVITTFADPSIDQPDAISAGPDGALWFTNIGSDTGHPSIGRISTAGTVTAFADEAAHSPVGITAGPDGAVWFTNDAIGGANNDIGRITAAGSITYLSDAGTGANEWQGITTGPDGAVWFAGNDVGPGMGRVTTDGVFTYFPQSVKLEGLLDVATGPDDALWYANVGTPGSIGRITTGGLTSRFRDPSIVQPVFAAAGPDGALWFINMGQYGPHAVGPSIGRIATSGAVTNYADPAFGPPGGPTGADQSYRIAPGPDGAMWFADSPDNLIGRITMAGVVTNFTSPQIHNPADIVAGPDGAMWFTNIDNNTIGRITVPSSASVYPQSGPAGASIDISGTGFSAGETVTASYKTGPSSPASVTLCSATATAGGSVDCSATIPTTNTGATGAHTIALNGASSSTTASTPFTVVQSAVALTLGNGWTTTTVGTAAPAAELTSGIVHLKGAMATAGTNPVAFTLPANLRPTTDVYLPVDLCNSANGRLRIQPSGVVTVQAEGAFSDAQCRTSLDGASYALSAPNALTLQNGWTNAPLSTGNAAAVNVGGIVHLKGAIATSGSNPVAFTLPGGLRPATTTYVKVDLCNSANGRLVIAPTGQVTVQAQLSFADAACFTSLDGVSYALTAHAVLSPLNGWHSYSAVTARAGASAAGGIVQMKGAIATSGINARAFTLPANLRPANTVYVPVDLCGASNGRLIIAPSGSVVVQAQSSFSDAQCFTSLDGVSYTP